MVYLNVYDTIFEYLEDIGIVDEVFEFSDDILKSMFRKDINNKFHNEFVLELALFQFMHENKSLINFLAENLYDSLSADDKKAFDAIKESSRYNLRFTNKVKLDQLDTNNRELYDFQFTDLDTNEIKLIVSSAPLEEKGLVINARLIRNPLHAGKYAIIGGILDANSYSVVKGLCELKLAQKTLQDSKMAAEHLLRFSKEHSLKEIEKYDDEESRFIVQDRIMMRINRQFYEKFEIGIDDFLKNLFELSNHHDKFVEMTEYYLSIIAEFHGALGDTNYIFKLPFLFEKTLVEGFLAFIKKDSVFLEKSIDTIKKEEKDEFDSSRGMEIALTREKIMEHQKKQLIKHIAPLNLDSFDLFFKKLESYPPEEIDKFLKALIDYLKKNYGRINPKFELEFLLHFLEHLFDNAMDIPYRAEIEEAHKEIVYDSEEFYSFIDANDEVISLLMTLQAAYFVDRNEFGMAYRLVKENKINRTDSFDQLFLLGKILSFFNDKEYKTYFRKAKGLDKARYTNELTTFLRQKEQSAIP